MMLMYKGHIVGCAKVSWPAFLDHMLRGIVSNEIVRKRGFPFFGGEGYGQSRICRRTAFLRYPVFETCFTPFCT